MVGDDQPTRTGFSGSEGGHNMSRKIQGMTLLQVSDVMKYWMAWGLQRGSIRKHFIVWVRGCYFNQQRKDLNISGLNSAR